LYPPSSPNAERGNEIESARESTNTIARFMEFLLYLMLSLAER
jgi:hypothetical protein